MDDIQFKVRGVRKLLSYKELLGLSRNHNVNKIMVVDLKSQKNYETGIITILRKFR